MTESENDATYFLQIEEDMYKVEELHRERSWYKKYLTIATMIYPKKAMTQRRLRPRGNGLGGWESISRKWSCTSQTKAAKLFGAYTLALHPFVSHGLLCPHHEGCVFTSYDCHWLLLLACDAAEKSFKQINQIKKLSNTCYFEYPSSQEENFGWPKFFSPSIFKQGTVGIGTKDVAFSGCKGKHILRRKHGCACEEGGCCKGNNGHVCPSPYG